MTTIELTQRLVSNEVDVSTFIHILKSSCNLAYFYAAVNGDFRLQYKPTPSHLTPDFLPLTLLYALSSNFICQSGP